MVDYAPARPPRFNESNCGYRCAWGCHDDSCSDTSDTNGDVNLNSITSPSFSFEIAYYVPIDFVWYSCPSPTSPLTGSWTSYNVCEPLEEPRTRHNMPRDPVYLPKMALIDRPDLTRSERGEAVFKEEHIIGMVLCGTKSCSTSMSEYRRARDYKRHRVVRNGHDDRELDLPTCVQCKTLPGHGKHPNGTNGIDQHCFDVEIPAIEYGDRSPHSSHDCCPVWYCHDFKHCEDHPRGLFDLE
jgi:hypothetical protein